MDNIREIILPAYTSHVTQPFDVCVASSFKTYLQKRSDCLPNWALDEMSNLNDTAKKKKKVFLCQML